MDKQKPLKEYTVTRIIVETYSVHARTLKEAKTKEVYNATSTFVKKQTIKRNG